jgi:cobalt-zinc-cadmium efflux system membrane fusion protein
MRDSLLPLTFNMKWVLRGAAAAGVAATIAALSYLTLHGKAAHASGAPVTASAASEPAVQLTAAQLGSIKMGIAAERTFPQERTAVGNIDFNENLAVQVFTPYQGKIIKAYLEVGDSVAKGQTLFTIESPDLIQAESTLIGAAATLDQTASALARARKLYAVQGIDQNDYETAVANQQIAEGALKAGRDAVQVFGKSAAEIDAMIANRKIDPTLVVPSPIAGRVTARAAQPGLLVQPGNAPAPYTVADVVTVWMLANVSESNIRYVHAGQDVSVATLAYPDQVYAGKITNVGTSVDPNLHTLLIRSEIQNPRRELLPGMLANFVIRTGTPITSVAVPQAGIVREGDGTMTLWVTTDQRRFLQRTVRLGLESDGYVQVLDGLKPGERVVTEGAVLLDNLLTPTESD